MKIGAPCLISLLFAFALSSIRANGGETVLRVGYFPNVTHATPLSPKA